MYLDSQENNNVYVYYNVYNIHSYNILTKYVLNPRMKNVRMYRRTVVSR